MDLDSIPPGEDYREVLDAAIEGTDVLLVLMGQDWLELLQARASDPADFVRYEIETAIRKEKLVIPVLVGDVEMPSENELPESIAKMAYFNAHPLDPRRHFVKDVELLVRKLDKHFDVSPPTKKKSKHPFFDSQNFRLAVVLVFVLAVVVSAYFFWPTDAERAVKVLTVATQLEEKGDYDDAILKYDEALELNPNLLLAYHGKAKALYRDRRTDEAARVVEKGLKIGWDEKNEKEAVTRARLRLLRGTIKTRERQYQEAELDLRQGLEILRPFTSPDTLSVKASLEGTLGGTYQRWGKVEEAQKSYQQAIDFGLQSGDDRGVVQDQYNLATLLRTEGEFSKAEETLRSALKTSVRLDFWESQVHIWWGLARNSEEAGHFEDAIEEYKRALDICRNPDAELPNKMRTIGKVQGDFGAFLVDLVISSTEDIPDRTTRIHEAEIQLKEALALSVGVQQKGDGMLAQFDLDGVGAQSANLGRLWLNVGQEMDAAALIVVAHAIFLHLDPKLLTEGGDEELIASVEAIQKVGNAPLFGSSEHLQLLEQTTGIPAKYWEQVFVGVPPP